MKVGSEFAAAFLDVSLGVSRELIRKLLCIDSTIRSFKVHSSSLPVVIRP